MAAPAKGKRKALEGGVGLGTVSLTRRRLTRAPAATLAGAAGDAEQARGGESDLVIVAVEPGRLEEALELVREALA